MAYDDSTVDFTAPRQESGNVLSLCSRLQLIPQIYVMPLVTARSGLVTSKQLPSVMFLTAELLNSYNYLQATTTQPLNNTYTFIHTPTSMRT